eukprot:UN28334
MQLYKRLNGKQWTFSDKSRIKSWKGHLPLNKWHGVECDSKGQLTHLELTDINLVGQMPQEFPEGLENIIFSGHRNQLSGDIPQSYPHTLRHLDLSNTKLNSSKGFPVISPDFLYLDLTGVSLKSDLPHTLPRALRVLTLNDTNIRGHIPLFPSNR